MNNGNISSIKDMFHIPNNMRGIVKTERFSAPGYPCLYIGNTVYDCWEEMGRPSFDDMVFSGFKVVREFKVYDLRKPAFSDYEKDRLHQTLLRLVYVIACQFKVCNREEPFKPEYIIPQMILELIISINRKKKEYDCGPYSLVWGVIYTSTHLSEDFPYREDFLENIAIPVIDTDNTHCNILASLFQISLPVCYRYEELKDNNTKNDQEKVDKNDTDINAIYFSTKMGFLESRIIENTKFEELPYIAIPCPDKILYDWKGNLTNIPSPDIQIYSNEAWHIETKKKPQE